MLHLALSTQQPISLVGLTLKVPEELQLYGLYVYYVVHICDFGMLRVNELTADITKFTLWLHFCIILQNYKENPLFYSIFI